MNEMNCLISTFRTSAPAHCQVSSQQTVFLILRRYMKMSQSQFDSLDENTRQSFLEKRLWIRENYEVCDLKVSLCIRLSIFPSLYSIYFCI